MVKPLYFAVFYKTATNTVCRIEHRDTDNDLKRLKPSADERMLTVSYANKTNLDNMLLALGLKGS